MSGAVATAVVASAVIGVAGSIYSASESKKAQREATNAQREAQRKAEEEARRIAMERRPDEISATLEVGGSTSVGTDMQTTADFLIPKQTSLGTAGKSGLGFSI